MVRKKDRLFKLWAKTLHVDHRTYYVRLGNDTNAALRVAERDYILKECENLKVDKNCKNWWSTVKKIAVL